MGVNFYLTEALEVEQADGSTLKVDHVGKLMSAGSYCWNCGISLEVRDSATIHMSYGVRDANEKASPDTVFETCPLCGEVDPEEPEELTETVVGKSSPAHDSAAGLVLGFSKATDIPRKGLSTACSFTWGIPFKLLALGLWGEENCPTVSEFLSLRESVPASVDLLLDGDKIIKDEDGNLLTLREFFIMLIAVPPEFNFICPDVGREWD